MREAGELLDRGGGSGESGKGGLYSFYKIEILPVLLKEPNRSVIGETSQ